LEPAIFSKEKYIFVCVILLWTSSEVPFLFLNSTNQLNFLFFKPALFFSLLSYKSRRQWQAKREKQVVNLTNCNEYQVLLRQDCTYAMGLAMIFLNKIME